jgi:hypothetical protein
MSLIILATILLTRDAHGLKMVIEGDEGDPITILDPDIPS